jgi:hypothetical protein
MAHELQEIGDGGALPGGEVAVDGGEEVTECLSCCVEDVDSRQLEEIERRRFGIFGIEDDEAILG